MPFLATAVNAALPALALENLNHGVLAGARIGIEARGVLRWLGGSPCYPSRMVAGAPAALGSPPRMSDEAWANLPEDEPGELVEGVLVDEEVPDWIHETAIGWLIQVLRGWGVPRGGFIGGSELKYLLRQGRGRKPDVSMVLPGQRPPPRRGPSRRAPDVMIEVVSPRPRDVRRDRIEKLREYAAFGVR